MAAAIEEIAGARPRPDLVVVITDGLTGWPTERPVPDVIVALVQADLPAGMAAPLTVPDPPHWANVVRIA
jgi:hypothetical protein